MGMVEGYRAGPGASAAQPGARSLLSRVALLALLPDEVRALVEASFEPVAYSFGTVIEREGDPATAFYVLVSGTARVIKAGDNGEEVLLNTIRPGEAFGELALLEETHRSATVRASSPVEALRLDRTVFQALVRSNPELRHSVALQARRHRLRDFFRVHSDFARLPADALAQLLGELRVVDVERGEVVVRENEPAGPMYVVQDGRLRAYQERDGTSNLSFLRTGDYFGERSLLKGEPRSATVEAVADSTLLELAPEAFGRLMDEHPAFRDAVARRVAQYDYKQVARVPLDFAEEVLPVEAGDLETVAPDQVDEVLDVRKPRAPARDEGVDEGGAGELFERPRRRIRRFPHVWQVDEMDCGAASLAMVCRHFGRKVSLAHIRRVVHTSSDGTSLAGIASGAKELGLAARTIKASKANLDSLPLPAVVHWEAHHWMVLYDTAEGHVRVADPAAGPRRIDRADFERKWSGYAVLFSYTPSFEDAPEGGLGFGWLREFFSPYRGTFLKALVLALVAAGLQMLIPVLSQVIVDSVIADRDYDLLTVLVLGMLAVLVFATAATIVQGYMLSRAAVKIDGSTLDFLTDRLLALPMTYFNARRTGDIERRLAGMQQTRRFLVQNGLQGLGAVTQLVVAFALMCVYSWKLALVYLAFAPLYAGLMRFSQKRLRPIFDSLEEAHGKYSSRQIDAVKGIETVKAMSVERSLRRLMRAQFDDLAQRVFRADFTIMAYDAAVQLVTFLSLALFLWAGALQVLSGDMTIGELVSFSTLVVLANGPLATVLLLWDQFQYSSVLLDRLNDVLEHEPEQGADHSHLAPVPTLEGRVSLQAMGFHYGGPIAAPILEDISLDVAPGTKVAIVGRSGSGKTTLVKCLAGLLEPTAGRILYDGVDLQALEFRDLRRHVGFVLQDSYLFDETIARNISLGEDEPDMERVLWAARAANAHEFVERLPLGYETRVGETGLRLSGGQAQRIAIARAVYRRPPVLILDEATSSLDTESERAVKDNLDRLLEGRTSFVIAHRLSTVRDADLIVVLERGRLVEQGTHEELMERQGLYFYLAGQQLDL